METTKKEYGFFESFPAGVSYGWNILANNTWFFARSNELTIDSLLKNISTRGGISNEIK